MNKLTNGRTKERTSGRQGGRKEGRRRGGEGREGEGKGGRQAETMDRWSDNILSQLMLFIRNL